MFRQTVLGFVLATVAASAAAAGSFEVSATNASEFRQQADGLRTDMQAGGKYASLSDADKGRVEKQLGELEKIFDAREAKGANEGKAGEAKAVASINTILAGGNDEKLVCENVRKLGSQRPERVCTTAAQRRIQQDESRNALDRAKGGRN